MVDEPEIPQNRPRLHNINDDPEAAQQHRVAGADPLEIQAMRLFVQENGDRFRFNHTRGLWMEWTGLRWVYDEKQRSRYEMMQLVDRMRRADAANRRALGKISFADHALSGARSQPRCAVVLSQFDNDPYLLGTPTGYVDLRTGQHHKPDADKMISKATTVSPSDADPKQWIKFMKWATGDDEELYRYMHKFLGYCLSGLMNEEIMSFVYGSGGNGKGVMLSAIAHILGDYYVNTPSSTFMDTRKQEHATELARLNGARLVSASETGEDDKWNLSRIKEITGNENPISARFMRQDFFEFWPVCKLMIIGNNKPQMGEVDAAIARRLRLIEFTQRPVKVDETLKDRMAKEYGKILGWMIKGFQLYQEEGLKPPDSVMKASGAYLASEDVVSAFLNAVIHRSSNDEHYVTRQDISDLIPIFKKDNGMTQKLSARSVYRRITEGYGCETAERGRKRSFIGIRIHTEWQAALDLSRELGKGK